MSLFIRAVYVFDKTSDTASINTTQHSPQHVAQYVFNLNPWGILQWTEHSAFLGLLRTV